MLVSDYLVGKVLYTEKKVLETINKLNIVKRAVLNTSDKPNLDGNSALATDLLS